MADLAEVNWSNQPRVQGIIGGGMGRNGEAGKRAGKKRTAVARQVKRENENANSLAKHFASAMALCGNEEEEEEEKEEEKEEEEDPHDAAEIGRGAGCEEASSSQQVQQPEPEEEQSNHDGRGSGDEEEDLAAETARETPGCGEGRGSPDRIDSSSSRSSSSQQDGGRDVQEPWEDESNHAAPEREEVDAPALVPPKQHRGSCSSGPQRKMNPASTLRSSSFGGQRGGAFAAPSSSKPSSSSSSNRASSRGAARGGAFSCPKPQASTAAGRPHRTAAGPLTAAPVLDHALPHKATTMSWREPIIDRSSSSSSSSSSNGKQGRGGREGGNGEMQLDIQRPSSSSSSSSNGKQGRGGGEGGNGEMQLEIQSPDREVPPLEHDTDEYPDEMDQGDTMLTASFTDIGESDDSWREDSSSGDAAGNTTESDSDCSQGEGQRLQEPAEMDADAEADRGGGEGGGGGGGRGRGRGGNTRDSAIGEGRNAAEPTIIPRPDFESHLTKESVAHLAEVDGLRVENVNINALSSLSTCPYEGACYLPKVRPP